VLSQLQLESGAACSGDEVDPILQIAVIGDIHDLWERTDQAALKQLGVDLALFVGDFGNEAVEIVQAIARLDLPIAVALGNHDAWFTATPWGRQKCPYDRRQEDRVQQQLDLLGEAHIGYDKRDFLALRLAVVGGRPFSWGGGEWKYEEFYQQRFGVNSFRESTARMVAAATRCTADTILVLSHNGPSGLGDRPEDPCGRDWYPLGGDYGDPDLQAAIAEIKGLGKTIPLVTFGHMHHQLRHTHAHSRTVVKEIAGTVYLNAALVPRIREHPQGGDRNFFLVKLHRDRVIEIKLVWLSSSLEQTSEQVFFCS
jgi:uncharacterized protein (TIGR04168 family)